MRTHKFNLVQEIARVAHEVNRAYCKSLGDDSQPEWKKAPDWQKESAENGVKFHLKAIDSGKVSTPEKSHENWFKEKEKAGWKYGKKRDPEKKLHPCFVPYDKLPQEQKSKDFLFQAIVESLLKWK